ncbi:hypothetical protein CP533_4820 [Ophiocordyceps camponoti-saundersi (nom. inval.)]|nr:hypothetical protein CP533_4820 [Ophiocordyceps camponoti-saundersi (nom. inval.)]
MTEVSRRPITDSPESANGSIEADPEFDLSPPSRDWPLTRRKQRDGRAQGQHEQPRHETAVSSPADLDRPASHMRSKHGQGQSQNSWTQSQSRSIMASRGGETFSLPARPMAQTGGPQQRNYTAPPAGPRGSRADSVAAASPPRGGGGGGGNWNGGRHHGKGRGGGRSHGQPRYEAGHNSPQADYTYDHQSWRESSWRRPLNEPLATQECRNDNRNGNFSYRPCNCPRCNERNRSVWVVVHERPEIHPADVGARLRHGMGGRFGDVETVIPTNSYDGIGFIVRFRNESSVPMALEFASGLIPEKQLSLAISAVYGSKWVNSTWQYPMSMPHDQGRIPPVNQGPAGGYPVLNMYGMHPIPDHAAQASPIYPVFHGSVNPPVGLPGPPMGYNSNHSNTSPVMMAPPPVAYQPYHDDGYKSSTVPTNISPMTILKSDRSEATKPVMDEAAQTKPPSEEALGGVVAVKPCSPQKKSHEARVSLPTSSPQKVVKEVEKKKAPRCDVQPFDAMVKNLLGGASATETKQEKEVGVKEAHIGEVKADEAKTGEVKAEEPKQKDSKEATDKQKESTIVQDKTKTTTAGKDNEVQPKEEKQRVSSIFTEQQIEDRRRAWDRIPMPLNPQKGKKAAVENTNKPTASTAEQKPASDATKAGSDGGAKSVKGATTTADKGSIRRQDGNAQHAGPHHERGRSQDMSTGRDTAKKSKRNKKSKSSRGTLPVLWGPQAGESSQQGPSTAGAYENAPETTSESPSAADYGARDRTPPRPRQAYRADAGGSIRQDKKRRGRATGTAADDFDSSSSNGTPTPSSSSSSLTLLTTPQQQHPEAEPFVGIRTSPSSSTEETP